MPGSVDDDSLRGPAPGPPDPPVPPGPPGDGTTSRVTSRVVDRGRHATLLVVAGLVVVLVAGLGFIGRLGGDGPDDQLDATPSTLFQFSTTSSPSTTLDVAPVPTATSMAPGDFMLGEPTGLWLFYGGVDSLRRLDLDTAELVDFGIDAFPLLATGDDIVLYQADSRVTGWVSARRPGEQALNWKRGPVAADPEPHRVWILDPEVAEGAGGGADGTDGADGTGRWERFDTEANLLIEGRPGELYVEVLERPALPLPPGRAEVLRPGPELATRPDGVYVIGPRTDTLVSTGRLLAYDDLRILVAPCADGECPPSWHDRTTGVPLGLPSPSAPVAFAEIIGGGRWLRWYDAAGQLELLDLRSSATLRFPAGTDATVSPDGRWLAAQDGDRVAFTDLFGDGSLAGIYVNLATGDGGNLLFVEQ